MSEELRELTEEERPQAVALWDLIFGGGGSATGQPDWLRDPWRDRDHLFGCLVDGRVVSTVCVMYRPVHVPGGKWAFGAIGGVATYEEFRGRGYSSGLMRMADDQMHTDGLDIGLLLTEINPFYEKLGWITVPRATFRATIDQPQKTRSQADVSEDIRWQELAPIYEDVNSDRSFAVDRTPEYWERWTTQCLRGATGIVIRQGSKPIAYAVVRPWRDGVGVDEIGWVSGYAGAASRIADELLALAALWGCAWIGSTGPSGGPEIIAALDRPGVSVARAKDNWLMALPVRRTMDELMEACKPFESGRGTFWPLDDF